MFQQDQIVEHHCDLDQLITNEQGSSKFHNNVCTTSEKPYVKAMSSYHPVKM